MRRPTLLPDPSITVVSGLPRAGTSLMMQMLAAGGLPPLTDGVRPPDDDNPHGYFEFDPTKRLATDAAWMGGACGKAIKVVSALLRHLPAGFAYDILFMHRPLDEILASQATMLDRRGTPSPEAVPGTLAAAFTQHLRDLDRWLETQRHLRVLRIAYDDLVQAPAPQAVRVAEFLGRPLDVDRMAAAVEPTLYRHRS